MNDDLISREAAIEALHQYFADGFEEGRWWNSTHVLAALEQLPPAQQTLYGYKIEHLAYIARVMEKEGVTAEYAVRTFDDMSRAIKQKVEEALNERFN